MKHPQYADLRAAALFLILGTLMAVVFMLFTYRSGFELALYLAIICPVIFFGPVLELLRKVHFVRFLMFSLFLTSLIAAQMYSQSLSTYPLVTWDMYSRATKSEPNFFEIRARFADGSDGPFPFEEVLPLNPRRVQGKVASTLQKLAAATRANDSESIAVLRGHLETLAALYDAKNPDLKITSLELIESTLNIDDYTGRESITRATLSACVFE